MKLKAIIWNDSPRQTNVMYNWMYLCSAKSQQLLQGTLFCKVKIVQQYRENPNDHTTSCEQVSSNLRLREGKPSAVTG